MAYYGNTIGGILQQWSDFGVFAYLLPFLMIFAFVYGILTTSRLLGDNKGVNATIAIAVGLLSLQFDYVSTFFATIFPYTGMGISVLLVAFILMGIVGMDGSKVWVWFGIGAVIFIIVVLSSLTTYSWWGGGYGLQGSWPAILSALIALGLIALIIFGGGKNLPLEEKVHNMVLDTSAINFFVPIFSFLFVFVIVYAVLAKTKLLGGNKYVDLTTGFIMSIIFISFSSAQRYVETIVPWAAVMMVVVFLILLLAGLSTDDLKKIMTTKFAWSVISVLILIFIIAAIRVFNPVFHQDYILVSGDKPQVVSQILYFFNSGVTGGVLLLVTGLIVAWIITKK